jgi:type I restriction enzyme S subunit
MGTAFLRLHPEHLLDTPFPVPSVGRQHSIADYLDAETARIDALIEKKRQIAALVQERWQASLRVLAHDTLPWVPLRRIWRIIDCKHRTPNYQDDGFPVVSPGDIEPGRLELGRCHRFVSASDFADLTEGERRPQRGDVVYSRNASIGIAAFVDTDVPFTMGQDVCVIRSDSASQLWLTYMLNSVGLDQLQEMKVGATFDRVNIDQLLNLKIPSPPLRIQAKCARALDASEEKVRRVTATIARQVALLSEYRQAVVSAVVTGEAEVPGAAT